MAEFASITRLCSHSGLLLDGGKPSVMGEDECSYLHLNPVWSCGGGGGGRIGIWEKCATQSGGMECRPASERRTIFLNTVEIVHPFESE